MAQPLLVLEDVEKRFGGLRAIAGVSLEVPERQIFGLIGPNGAGKTTLFNCITGNYVPERGDVRFAGRSIRGQAPHRIALAGIGRTFQNVRLFTQMTVLENVMVAAHHRTVAGVLGAMLRTKHYGDDERALRGKALELLEIFELHGVCDELAGSLPYGKQRRLEIARALMLEPKLILLDEPAAGLNSREADTLKTQIRWLRDRFALTIVLVEHNMQVVMGACEQVLCMDHGESIAYGTPEEIRNHPAVLAAYLGKDADTDAAADVAKPEPAR
ncbi:MAG TPA: ABC transporter ATP-binding protein [Polyangiales bacterium]|nr:ABC transporter ATP-binding protein [Polyangiales bacterium]